MYSVRMLDAATRELARLDKPIGRRIVERINWLAENFDEIDPKTLTAELAGFFKLRVGDYRVLYQMLHDEQLIVIHLIGHRREIYRKGKRR
ncbi:MAG: type II toxin-antitoxin system RelE family toxin [Nitrospiraceae bacterium]